MNIIHGPFFRLMHLRDLETILQFKFWNLSLDEFFIILLAIVFQNNDVEYALLECFESNIFMQIS